MESRRTYRLHTVLVLFVHAVYIFFQCVRLVCKLVKSKSYNTRPAVSHYETVGRPDRFRLVWCGVCMYAGPEEFPALEAAECG